LHLRSTAPCCPSLEEMRARLTPLGERRTRKHTVGGAAVNRGVPRGRLQVPLSG